MFLTKLFHRSSSFYHLRDRFTNMLIGPLAEKIPGQWISGLRHPDHLPVVACARTPARGNQNPGNWMGYKKVRGPLASLNFCGCSLEAGHGVQQIGRNVGIYPIRPGSLPVI
jgi:hypothetical protein